MSQPRRKFLARTGSPLGVAKTNSSRLLPTTSALSASATFGVNVTVRHPRAVFGVPKISDRMPASLGSRSSSRAAGPG
ncbi:hypothetical protein ACN26Z_07690 [Verrucosispora sp. WMMD703]|uniref:hypothetical protein n=1 Tax=Verrucosispora sp. WMMD703 TaxID=3403463 RepID=UPI003B9387CC